MIRYLLFILLLCSCQKNDFDITITNKSLSPDGTLSIDFKNNTNDNYLFYFGSKRMHYFGLDAPNTLNLIILKKDKPVDVFYSSSPWVMLDEEGNPTHGLSEEKYFKGGELYLFLPSKEKVTFKANVIDSIDEFGGSDYPILEKNTSYKAILNLKLDSSVIRGGAMEKINKIIKEKNAKLFQGRIISNTVKLEY